MDITELKFDDSGRIPAIVVDAETDKVLMLAYMNKESLQISLDEGKTCFWSRSRSELWRKGATSGNVQHIVDIKTDCDNDTLLISVKAEGPPCHTGANTCFYNEVYGNDDGRAIPVPTKSLGTKSTDAGREQSFSLVKLYDLIKDRKVNPKAGSYTTYLFDKGKDKILKKLGEETAEIIIASKSEDKAETTYELADLVYHCLVLMTEMGITPDDVIDELTSRYK